MRMPFNFPKSERVWYSILIFYFFLNWIFLFYVLSLFTYCITNKFEKIHNWCPNILLNITVFFIVSKFKFRSLITKQDERLLKERSWGYLDSLCECFECFSGELYWWSALRDEGHDGDSGMASNNGTRHIGLQKWQNL